MNPSQEKPEQSEADRSNTPSRGFIERLYRQRWVLSIAALFSALLLFVQGVSTIGDFSARVDSMSEAQIENPQPKMFDTRTDIWFDPLDEGLLAYRDVEDQFIAEDVVIVAFEEKDDAWGVFGPEPLALIEELTNDFVKVPYVRNVRSITSSPWIRNGEVAPGEQGLVVTDLFDKKVAEFSKEERLQRMIAVLGAEGASRLAGKAAVQEALGPGEQFADHAGEPRFVDSIISADGRTAAIQIQVIRQKPDEAALAAAFPTRSSGNPDIGSALHTIEAQGSAVGKIAKKLESIQGREMHITGIPVIERHFPEVGQRDMAWLGLMFVIIGLALMFIYRKVSGVVIPLLVVFASIMAMNGTVWLMGDLINNLTASAPIIMTAVGVADAVHLVTAYFLLRPHFTDKNLLVIEVLRKNALPVFLTTLTTVVAFLSLVVSPIVPVKELGYTAAIGTAAAYLLSMTVVPAILSLFALPEKKPEGASEAAPQNKESRVYWTERLATFVERRRTGILAVSIATLAVAAVGIRELRVESDIRMMFPATDPVVADQNWIEDHLGGAGDLDLVFYGAPAPENTEAIESAREQLEFLSLKKVQGDQLDTSAEKKLLDLKKEVRSHDRGRIASHGRFLDQVDRFEARLKEESAKPGSKLKVISSFDSGLSVLRRMHQVQNENKGTFYRVPEEEDVAEAARTPRVLADPFSGDASLIPAQSASSLAAQYYLQYENGAKPAENLTPFVSPDRRGFRIAGRVKSQSSADMLLAYDEIRKIARSEFPEIAGTEEQVAKGAALSTMRLSGKHYLFMNMMERFTATLINSLALALLVITLVIGVVFRSVRVALVSMVPNVMPLLVPLALFGILGISLDGPAVIVATIALGICVDDTIHLLTKFEAARKAGLGSSAAVRVAFRQVGGALTWTTLTLVLGFSVLILSDFRPNMLIGAVGAVMVALAWVADLLVTPALLTLMFPEEEAAPEASPSLESPQPAE